MVPTSEILDVLRSRGIDPEEPDGDLEFPEIGQIGEDESVYATSLDDVLGSGREGDGAQVAEMLMPDTVEDGRLSDVWREIEVIAGDFGNGGARAGARPLPYFEAPEPHCAWYCPIHYFGHGWGIYIRERYVIECMIEIIRCVDWIKVPLWRNRPQEILSQLKVSAFYCYYLHEQFHHKVESFGFRLLLSTNSDRFRPYKAGVYRPSFLTKDCLEESLANADSYRRLSEPRYMSRVETGIRQGLRRLLKGRFHLQPPGYAEAVNYLSDLTYREGLHRLQSQIVEATLNPKSPSADWSIAPNMITALTDITDEIYVVLPQGARPLFKKTSFDPGATISTDRLVAALKKYYGYVVVPGGKGSHVKLQKAGAQPIIIPGNRPVLSPGVVKQVLNALGGYPISKLPQVLAGQL